MLLSYSPKGACAFAGWRGVCVSQCVCMCLTSREGYRVHSRYATHHERYVRVSVTFGLVQLALLTNLLLFCFCFSFVAYPFIAVFFCFRPAGRPPETWFLFATCVVGHVERPQIQNAHKELKKKIKRVSQSSVLIQIQILM